MIVCLTVGGQPAEVTIRIPSSSIPDESQRASRAADVAFTQQVAAIRREWNNQGRTEDPIPDGFVTVEKVYCCDRCRRTNPELGMQFRHPGAVAAVRR